MSPPQSAREERLSDRRKIGQMQEERKRGQRLFGALLGTLSQSSSSTANKRRADIEKKQQGKLRMQTEEDNEKKKAELEDLMAMRRMEQKKYDRESVRSHNDFPPCPTTKADVVLDATTAFELAVTGKLFLYAGGTQTCTSFPRSSRVLHI